MNDQLKTFRIDDAKAWRNLRLNWSALEHWQTFALSAHTLDAMCDLCVEACERRKKDWQHFVAPIGFFLVGLIFGIFYP